MRKRFDVMQYDMVVIPCKEAWQDANQFYVRASGGEALPLQPKSRHMKNATIASR